MDGRPVCLIHGGADGLRVSDEGLRFLEQLHEPIAVVCLAGQYRTGKSFFLNQLATTGAKDDDRAARPPRSVGFGVGPTTESCTRGIWLWDPVPTVRTRRHERVLFMDTEGMAATDNDESYDAKIFSLGLLLSSLFVFNTMGVIDEGAIDRLYLVSELTKHVCISSNTSSGPMSNGNPSDHAMTNGDDGLDDDDKARLKDPMAESRELAAHFPPFIWLLRDFLLEMKASDGTPLTPNEYLERSLDPRDGPSRRNEERNRIRMSIRVLFARRECHTLVRPVMDELQLRHAADLGEDELRPEFVEQMHRIRERILATVAPKIMFGKPMDGSMLAHLVKCYTDTMNSGAIPDIKAAWAYVSEATCQTAMLTAMEIYDTRMGPVTSGDESIMSQQDFEKLHKEAQDEAMTHFKTQSVEGSTRTVCFQRLKSHVQKQKAALIADLQRRSAAMCEELLRSLRLELLIEPLGRGDWDASFPTSLSRDPANQQTKGSAELFETALGQIESRYDKEAQGPAKKTTLFSFLRQDVPKVLDSMFARITQQAIECEHAWEDRVADLQQQKDSLENRLQQDLAAKAMEIKLLQEARNHAEEKDQMQSSRIEELLSQLQQLQTTLNESEGKRRELKQRHEELQQQHLGVERDLERTRLELNHTSSSLQQRDSELSQARADAKHELDSLRREHQQENEEWIQKLAERTAEKSSLQKSLKQKEHELQQNLLASEVQKKEHVQLAQTLAEESDVRKQREKECSRLRDLNVNVEKRLEESFARQMALEDELERERARLEQRLARFQTQLGRAEADREVEQVLWECVGEVVRLAEVEKIRVVTEERNVLQERLGELFLKISTLPEFYQREIFCSPDPTPSFFDVLTQ